MDNQHRKLPRLTFRHVLTGFYAKLEDEYFDDFYHSSLPIVRVALILGFALYSLFGFLDIWVVPLHKEDVWLIRYAVVCPMLAVTFALSYTGIFNRYMQAIMTFVSFVAGFGIVVMIGVASESELGFKFYYAGLMLVLMWIYTLIRLRFIYATAVSWIITITYEFIAVKINSLLGSPDNLTVFINNNFFFISANIIGMFASFTIEWYMRKNFLLRLEIQKANNLNQKYLDNIKEGLLLLDDDYMILDQYSGYLTGMFENTKIEGMHFSDLVYPDADKSKEERFELEKFLKFMFHNKSADLDMIMELNPFKNRKITINTGEYVVKEIIVNADFIRIINGGRVEFLMVIFEDITEIVKYEKELQGQKTRYQQEVESVTAILKSGPRIFSDFIDESTHNLINIRLKVNDLDDPAVFNHVFRETHSLKGSAKHLDLNFISSLAHKIEDMLLTSRSRPGNKAETLSQIEEVIVELFHEFQNLAKMIERLKVFSALDTVVKPPEWKGQLGEFLKSLPPMVDSLAQDLKKNAKLEIENSLEEIPFLHKIKNPLIHLIRNSIDHGIEDQFERLTKNKNAAGKITLRLSDSGDAYCIEVEDDGNGIDFDRIREKAIEKNLLEHNGGDVTKSKLLQLMFTVGFSSKDYASEISGRGYGLDIVKDAADQLNGKIMVNTKKDKGTKFIISIPH